MAWKIFVGVLGALLAFWLIVGVLTALGMMGAAAAVDQAVKQNTQQMQEQSRQYVMQRQQAIAYEASRRALASNQRCIGGVVIEVTGTSYTQLGSIGQPVHCLGQQADRPIR